MNPTTIKLQKMATFVENNFVKMTSTFTAEKMARMLTNEMMLDRNEVNSDLVFICEDKELAYPKEVMSLVFPLIKDLLPSSRGCCDLYLRKKDAKIYITLADVEADSFENIIEAIFTGQENFTTDPSEVVKVAEMFGAKHFLESKPIEQREEWIEKKEMDKPKVVDEIFSNNDEKMLQDAVDECENLEEASGYVENEPDNSLLKLSEEFFNCILKELMEEEVKQLLVENEDVSVKQFVVIEKDIIDFTPDEDVKQLTFYRQFLLRYVMIVYIRVSVVITWSLCRKEREKLDINLDSAVCGECHLWKFTNIILF